MTEAKARVIIVIDDDPSVLRALARLLRSEGFVVSAFERPSAVLSADLPRANACLLVDVYLPEMNGVKLCKALAASGCSLPIILMTGHLDARTREMTRHAGALAVLTKPFDKDALLDAVRKALPEHPLP